MTRVLVWKEMREQWPIWLALALVAAGAAAGLFALISPGPNRDEMLTAMLWLTAWGYGLVCGALLLAGDTEAETQPFLDSLPGTRPRIWRVKAATGLALLAAQFAALAAIGLLFFGQRYGQARVGIDLSGMLLCGVFGYAWGLYCGSSATNVLGAIARGVVLQATWAVALYAAAAFAMILYQQKVDSPLQGSILFGAMGLTAAGAAARSRTIYCQPDWLRAAALNPRNAKRAWTRRGEPFREACWQARWFALGMGLYGLAGVAALAFAGVASWPVLTLVIGVFCGITAFGEERGWVLRAGVRFAIGVGAAGIMTLSVLMPYVLRTDVQSANIQAFFRDRISASAVSALATDPTLFLAFWLVLGFACGLLAGSLFRRSVWAAAAGLASASAFGGVWLPTVYVGGQLHAWQLWAVPAVFLLATVVLASSRTAGRLTTFRALVVTACAFLAAGAGTAAALWYRANEMPPVPDAVDLAAFVASLPGPEENRGGKGMSNALVRLSVNERSFDSNQPRPTPRGPNAGPAPAAPLFGQFRSLAGRVVAGSWKAADPELGPFLDQVFRATWSRDLAAAAAEPAGMLVDLRDITFSTLVPQYQAAPTAALLLAARGLQRQDGGQPEEFVDNLRTGLAVARNIRHTPLALSALVSPGVEATMARGVERWLERLDGRPDLLRRALTTLRQHLDEPPADDETIRRTESLLVHNSLADLDKISRNGNGADPFFSTAFNDTPLLRFALSTPWEKMRYRRVLDGLKSNDPGLQRLARELAPPFVRALIPDSIGPARVSSFGSNPVNVYPCRVAALQVALRLYQAETGRPAEKLDELVPKYLPAVPTDPYDGRPFRYRLSRGETLDWPPDGYQFGEGKTYAPRTVPAGQGILWSVGKDETDDGGRVQEWPHPPAIARENEDRIALVPLPPHGP